MANPAVPLAHPPTIADIEALPPHMKGEILDGVFYAMTRPRGLHQRVLGQLQIDVGGPFQSGRGGPGGWWIQPEPGIEFVNSPEVSPDLAGWQRSRMIAPPGDDTIHLVPDWVCEILSSSTRRYDLRTKRPFYAKSGVPHLWVVDPDACVVIVSRLEGGRWLELGVWSDERDARIPPFEAAAIDVAGWWPEPPEGVR